MAEMVQQVHQILRTDRRRSLCKLRSFDSHVLHVFRLRFSLVQSLLSQSLSSSQVLVVASTRLLMNNTLCSISKINK
ncbi:hypothetical protein LINPERPRIM_LOCUS33846 [Linum perenne]